MGLSLVLCCWRPSASLAACDDSRQPGWTPAKTSLKGSVCQAYASTLRHCGSTKLKFRRSLQQSKEVPSKSVRVFKERTFVQTVFPPSETLHYFLRVSPYICISFQPLTATHFISKPTQAQITESTTCKPQDFTPTAAQKRNNNQPCLHPQPDQPTPNLPSSTSTAPHSRASGPAVSTKTPKP